MQRRSFAILLAISTAGCVQRRETYLGPRGANATQLQTLDLETSDRVARLGRLTQLSGLRAPLISVLRAPPLALAAVGATVPVTRVVFDEGAMFGPGSIEPSGSIDPILAIVADSMRRDVPDAELTVLGHTDAVGSDEVNDALSKARASRILARLIALRVDPASLSVAAIGRRQPVAPNDTEAGRSRNRRVEFLVSASYAANLKVISGRYVNPAWLGLGESMQRPPPPVVQILKPVRPAPEATADVDPDLLLRSTTKLPLAAASRPEQQPDEISIKPGRSDPS